MKCSHQFTRVPPPTVAPARMLRQVLSLFMAAAPSYIVLAASSSCSPLGLERVTHRASHLVTGIGPDKTSMGHSSVMS